MATDFLLGSDAAWGYRISIAAEHFDDVKWNKKVCSSPNCLDAATVPTLYLSNNQVLITVCSCWDLISLSLSSSFYEIVGTLIRTWDGNHFKKHNFSICVI